MTTENIALQAWRKDISYILHAVQGESDSRTFNFILYDQTGAVISPAGKTVSFYVQKPDGNIVMLATSTSGSTISVTLTLQACAVPGVMPCWIQLVDENGDDLRVDSLLLEVQVCDFDGAVESSSEFTALQEALGDVAKFSGHLTDYSNPHQVTAEQANAVPTERTVNGKPLSADITLNAPDVGAVPTAEKGQPNGIATLDAEGNLVQSHAAGFKLSVAQGGTGASDPVNARSNLGMGKLLWSGNWSSGSITVTGIENYNVILCDLNVDGRVSNNRLIALRTPSSSFCGIGGSINRTTNNGSWITTSQFDVSGNTLSNMDTWGYTHFFGSNHGSNNEYSISAIYGIC